ncbi:hypothetical protein PMAYCL1PPCAC_02724 [Pristionchus mayeri]|uniref:Uncharacterized protein n=1 Tax=Pristionchus mayeri TaxID=1317129 RepID=A0AAN4Z386_9BILA|nr:hypothetical protein PMAYCL1PPCAC_02724 [Pristionchus mayeri]
MQGDGYIEGTHSVNSYCGCKASHNFRPRLPPFSRLPFGRPVPFISSTPVESIEKRKTSLLIFALRTRTRRDDIDEDKEKNPFHTYLSSAAHDTAEGVE